MTKLYSTYDGELDATHQQSTKVYLAETGNLVVRDWSIDWNTKNVEYVIAPTNTYNANTKWTDNIIYDLLSSLAFGSVQYLHKKFI